jgi:hypothetical protein
MTEHGPVARLEQRCVRPGKWLIEGWNAHRVQDAMDSRNHWWTAEKFGESFTRHNLSDIREEITFRTERES